MLRPRKCGAEFCARLIARRMAAVPLSPKGQVTQGSSIFAAPICRNQFALHFESIFFSEKVSHQFNGERCPRCDVSPKVVPLGRYVCAAVLLGLCASSLANVKHFVGVVSAMNVNKVRVNHRPPPVRRLLPCALRSRENRHQPLWQWRRLVCGTPAASRLESLPETARAYRRHRCAR